MRDLARPRRTRWPQVLDHPFPLLFNNDHLIIIIIKTQYNEICLSQGSGWYGSKGSGTRNIWKPYSGLSIEQLYLFLYLFVCCQHTNTEDVPGQSAVFWFVLHCVVPADLQLLSEVSLASLLPSLSVSFPFNNWWQVCTNNRVIITIIIIIIIPGPLQRRGWTHRDFHRPFQTVARLPGQCAYLLKVGKQVIDYQVNVHTFLKWVIDYQVNINQNDHIQQKSSLSPALEYNEC